MGQESILAWGQEAFQARPRRQALEEPVVVAALADLVQHRGGGGDVILFQDGGYLLRPLARQNIVLIGRGRRWRHLDRRTLDRFRNVVHRHVGVQAMRPSLDQAGRAVELVEEAEEEAAVDEVIFLQLVGYGAHAFVWGYHECYRAIWSTAGRMKLLEGVGHA